MGGKSLTQLFCTREKEADRQTNRWKAAGMGEEGRGETDRQIDRPRETETERHKENNNNKKRDRDRDTSALKC